ncbi:MAG: formylglycine-generating enzyme family protein [Hyphomonas sp.]
MNQTLKIVIGGMGVLAVLGLFGLGVFRLATSAPAESYGALRDEEVFRDCGDCPDLLRIGPGAFEMGSRSRFRYKNLDLDSHPIRTVNIDYPFAAGRYEVTFSEWDACVADGGCGGYSPLDEGWGRGDRPVIHVSWLDAQAYVDWLSAKTGQEYRLLSEAEWEYLARGGVKHAFSWGRWPSHQHANYGEKNCCVGVASGADEWTHTSPAGSFPPNAFGVYDMAGNAYEWVEDCYQASYEGAPSDGSPFLNGDCERRRIRGGAWYSDPGRVRPSYRAYQAPSQRDYVIGFRVARDMPYPE